MDKATFLLLLSIIQVNSTPVKSTDSSCMVPMGMQSGHIKDNQITATSSFQAHSVGPARARFNMNIEGGAWCPKSYVSKDGSEYMEIDLVSEARITGVLTQGRHANGIGQEYAEFFMLEYWRQGMDEFAVYTGSDGGVVMVANDDTNSEAKIILEDGGIVASKVRVIPYSPHLRTVCMRVELLGCDVIVEDVYEAKINSDEQMLAEEESIVESDDNMLTNTTQDYMGTKSLGVLAGILFTMTVLLLVVIFLLLKARRSSSSNLKKLSSLGSTVSVSSSVVMEHSSNGYKYTLGTSKPSNNNQTSEPIYQEPGFYSNSTASPCVCDYSSPISVIYTSPLVQVGSDIYSVYQTPSFMKDSLTDISYLEESSVDSSSTSSGTPRLPPLPTHFNTLMKPTSSTPIYTNYTEL